MNKLKAIIITKDGKGYTDEGTKYLSNELIKRYGNIETTFMMGSSFNKTSSITKLLENPEKDTVFIVSTDKGIHLIENDELPKLYINFKENPNMTPWEILIETYSIAS